MKFAIFREIEIDGKRKRKILVDWDEDRIKEELIIQFKKIEDVSKAFDATIRKFKEETIKIP